jgi:hypothetical protein
MTSRNERETIPIDANMGETVAPKLNPQFIGQRVNARM